MRTVFADTFYFIAQFNSTDAAHQKAFRFTNSFKGRMVATDWVMVELADAFARPPNRERFVSIYTSRGQVCPLSEMDGGWTVSVVRIVSAFPVKKTVLSSRFRLPGGTLVADCSRSRPADGTYCFLPLPS